MTTLAYMINSTEKAVAIVRNAEEKPLWLPRKKIVDMTESDLPSKRIGTCNEAIPYHFNIDIDFAKKVGWA